MKLSESEMQIKIIKKIAKWGKVNLLLQEVPHSSRCVDLVLINNKKNTIAIELKLSNWRKAYEQSLKDWAIFDYNYIAMPKPKNGWSEELLDLCRTNKVGLIEVDLSKDFPLQIIIQQKRKKDRYKSIIVYQAECFMNEILGLEYFKNPFSEKKEYSNLTKKLRDIRE